MLGRARYCYTAFQVICLPVRLSVTLGYRDHVGWKSSKIISRLVSLWCSLSADYNIMDLLQREHFDILTQNYLPHPCWIERRWHSMTIAIEWLAIAQWSQCRAYRKPPSTTPPSLPSEWGHKCAPIMICRIAYISVTAHPIHFMFRSMVGFLYAPWIDWRCFRLDKNQYGSRSPSWKITAPSCGFPATARLSCTPTWPHHQVFSLR